MNPVAQQPLGTVILGCMALTTIAAVALIFVVRAARRRALQKKLSNDVPLDLIDAIGWDQAALSELVGDHLARIYSRLNQLESSRERPSARGAEPAQAEAAQ